MVHRPPGEEEKLRDSMWFRCRLGLMFMGGLVLASFMTYASEHLAIRSFLKGFEDRDTTRVRSICFLCWQVSWHGNVHVLFLELVIYSTFNALRLICKCQIREMPFFLEGFVVIFFQKQFDHSLMLQLSIFHFPTNEI